MYKARNTYKSIYIEKEDLLKLENILRGKFPESRKLDIDIRTTSRDYSYNSFNELQGEDRVKDFYAISLYINEATGLKVRKSVYILITNLDVTVSIEGKDEVWVNGMAHIINEFFKEKKSVVTQLSNYIPHISGGLIGLNLPIFVSALIKDETIKAIWIGLIIVLVSVLTKYKNVKFFIPDVKLRFTPKPRKDLMLVLSVISTAAGVLALIVSTIALWIDL